ncbi:helix-turn-helix domain-containing protein [Ligilactobacillus animalis]|uniref:helix-turn-helix domain-containing protein n=1 Tax=Ligilactobacillus animalis TaxID=1605 RepID=UPI0025974A7D|nr:helix-turn-helix domain-containing protein [Ligilactobacillus animalis]
MSNRIRELRQDKKMTLKELGEAIGLAPNTISQYETGIREPKLKTWQKIADYFDVTVPYAQGVSNVRKDFSNEENPFKKWIEDIATGVNENGDVLVDQKVWEKEMPSFGVNMAMQDFKNISSAIVTELGFSLSEVEKFDNELLPEINDVKSMNEISRITRNTFKLTVLACLGDKKAKNYLATINNLINGYLGEDYFDDEWDNYALRDPFSEDD